MSIIDMCKLNAAKEALKHVRDASIIGVGTGSTVEKFIEVLSSEKVFFVEKFFVASSIDTRLKLAMKGFRVLDTVSIDRVDVYVDGADELDKDLNMIKGGGAAHTFEKILAHYSGKRIFIVDYTKLVDNLGSKHPVPVEVVPEAVFLVKSYLEKQGYVAKIRYPVKGKYGPVISDSRGLILDVYLASDQDPRELAEILDKLPGVVEHGLFIGYADMVIIGYPDGVKVITKEEI